jgi:hypothetical protein
VPHVLPIMRSFDIFRARNGAEGSELQHRTQKRRLHPNCASVLRYLVSQKPHYVTSGYEPAAYVSDSNPFPVCTTHRPFRQEGAT